MYLEYVNRFAEFFCNFFGHSIPLYDTEKTYKVEISLKLLFSLALKAFCFQKFSFFHLFSISPNLKKFKKSCQTFNIFCYFFHLLLAFLIRNRYYGGKKKFGGTK